VIVLDSSFIIGFYNECDALRSSAATLMERFLNGEWCRGLLLEYVFTGQGKTRLSFTDAAIAHVARERARGLVLTFDEEFRKLPGIRVPTASRH
jgi:predicted nucleic acid-binding protein